MQRRRQNEAAIQEYGRVIKKRDVGGEDGDFAMERGARSRETAQLVYGAPERVKVGCC